jgi:pimeloyl-ACP methyl ester carboxylesterase
MALLAALESAAIAALKLRGVRDERITTRVGEVCALVVPGRGALGTLVVQHGIGAASGLHFAPMFRALARQFARIVAVDLPAHGRSAAPSRVDPEALFDGFRDAIDILAPEGAFLYGNSLGGAMVTQYALETPHRVHGLFLTSPAGAPLDAQRLADIRATFAMPDRAATLDFLDKLYFRVPPGAGFVAHEIRSRFHRPELRSLIASFREGHGFDTEAVGALGMPIELWWPSVDRVMPIAFRDWWIAHLPKHAAILDPEGVGHCPHLDRPGFVAEALVRFAAAAHAGERAGR